MPSFSTVTEGKLTKKQEEALETMETITLAFYDEKEKKHQRRMKELKQITQLSSGVLSKHLRDLIKQDVIRGFVRIHNNRQTIFYEFNEDGFIEIKGKEPQKIKECVRVFLKGKETFIQEGYLKEVKLKGARERFSKGYTGKREWFVPTGPKRKI